MIKAIIFKNFIFETGEYTDVLGRLVKVESIDEDGTVTLANGDIVKVDGEKVMICTKES